MRRSGATAADPGDLVLVTGLLGRAAAGLRLLLDGGDVLSEQERAWIDAQLSPVARIAEGFQLVAPGVRCGGDISDGLLVELERIADLSGCGAEIWLDRLPVEASLSRGLRGVVAGSGRRWWRGLRAGRGTPGARSHRVCSSPGRQDLAPLTVVGRLLEGGDRGACSTTRRAAIGPPPRTSSRHFA